MTNASDLLFGARDGLPDPALDRQFYDRVPSRRLAAWGVDLVVIVALSLVLIPVIGVMSLGIGFFFIPVLFLAISYCYRVLTIANASATWGMRLMGIELRRGDGARFDLGYAAVHTALYTVCISLPVLQLASIVTVLTTPRGQTLPDLVLGTTAINSPED